MNKYEAVLAASLEAKRINDVTSKEELEAMDKPAVIALKRLADERLKIQTEDEEKD